MTTEVTEPNEQDPQITSDELEQRTLARMVRSDDAYRILCAYDRHFFDARVYGKFQQLFGENPLVHPAVQVFYAEKQRGLIRSTSGSTSENAAIAAREILKFKQELEAWTKSEPDEFALVQNLLEGIKQSGSDGLKHEQVVELFLKSPLCITGVSLAFQIYKAQQTIEKYQEESQRERTFRERRAPGLTTAAQRFQQFRAQQAEAEQD